MSKTQNKINLQKLKLSAAGRPKRCDHMKSLVADISSCGPGGGRRLKSAMFALNMCANFVVN
jgi:hypothetical protein